MTLPVDSSSVPVIAARRPWQVRDVDDATAAAIAEELGLHDTTARVLVGRGMSTADEVERFLAPSLDELHSPFAFQQMEPAVERLRHALSHHERIAVHGDYDVDGITGGVLLTTVLRHLGGDVDLLLPHRVTDGYGLQPSGVERAHEAGARLMVAVDCGITAHEACDRARELGIDVIVVDHHLPRPELPVAHAILNPKMEDSGYPEDDLAAVGVAFKLARGLLERDAGPASGISLLKLVALGTVADLVPLRGENRVMASHGLAGIAEAVNPGLRALLEVSGVDPRRVTAGDVAFRLAPRINAAGRIGHPDEAAELFLTADPGRARRLAGRLHRLNAERQELERQVFENAVEAGIDGDAPLIVVDGAGWHRGVIGIVASRLVERYGKPAIVIATDGDEGHGSARSIPGFDIVAALARADAYLTSYGGHKQAAGLRLPFDRLTAFREAVMAAAAQADPASLRAVLQCDDEIRVDAITPALALELERLAPFGIGNPRPRFLCRDMRLAGPARRLKEQHVKLFVRAGDAEIEAVGWRQGELAERLAGIDQVSLVASLQARTWGGRLRPQLQIEDLSAD